MVNLSGMGKCRGRTKNRDFAKLTFGLKVSKITYYKSAFSWLRDEKHN